MGDGRVMLELSSTEVEKGEQTACAFMNNVNCDKKQRLKLCNVVADLMNILLPAVTNHYYS